jgi:glycosyltransferase involved in cell wall biosynthesis
MKSRPKILFLITEDWYFLAHWAALGNFLQGMGFDVAVACRINSSGGDIEDKGFELFNIPFARESINPISVLKASKAIKKAINSFDPDLVIPIALRPIVLAWFSTISNPERLLFNFMAGRGSLFTDVEKKSFRLALARLFRDVFFARAFGRAGTYNLFLNNEDLKDFIENWGASPERSFRLPGSGIDSKSWVPTVEPKNVPPVILYVGRLLRDKGVGELVEASKILATRGVKHKLRFVGDLDICNPNSFLEDDLLRWKVEAGLEWLGRRNDVMAQMSQANIVALPSYMEGFSRVIVEAGLAMRAVVTCDTIGCREAVKNMDNGLLVPVRDAEALADALRILIEDAHLRVRLAQRNHERTLKEFSDDIVHPAVLRLCEAIIDPDP